MIPIHPIRNCRLWLLAIVVIVLAAASAAASQARAKEGPQAFLLGAIANAAGYRAVHTSPPSNRVGPSAAEANQKGLSLSPSPSRHPKGPKGRQTQPERI